MSPEFSSLAWPPQCTQLSKLEIREIVIDNAYRPDRLMTLAQTGARITGIARREKIGNAESVRSIEAHEEQSVFTQ